MLSLQLKSGEYITIGEDIAVQVFKQSGSTFRLEVKAPRELTILRGALRERGGGEPPDGLLDFQPVTPSRRRRSAENAEEVSRRKAARETQADALREMRAILQRMSEHSDAKMRSEIKALGVQLGRIADEQAPAK